MKTKIIFFTILFFALALSLISCIPVATPVPVEQASDEQLNGDVLVYPESDNDKNWSINSKVPIRKTVYTVRGIVWEESASLQTTTATGSYGQYGDFAAGGYRMEQNGKSFIPVKVVYISPNDFPGLNGPIGKGDTIILKVTDTKSMAIPNRAYTEWICNVDTEILSPVISNQELTSNRMTLELDSCRQTSPQYIGKDSYDLEDYFPEFVVTPTP